MQTSVCVCVYMCVCVYVCVSALRLLITSGAIWHDMDPIRLVTSSTTTVTYMATVVVIVNGRGLGISTHCRH